MLVDAARDILEYLLENQPKYASNLIRAWIDSPVPLLRRLAIHGMSEDKKIDPGEKIRWLIANNLVYR